MSSPFNEEKYKALLEGLEISEIMLGDVIKNNRIDAECYRKRNLFLNHIIETFYHKLINDFATVTDGEHGSPDLDDNSGILYLSGHNVKDNVLDLSDVRYCSKELHIKNSRSALTTNSVLLSIVGTIGNASVVYQDLIANTDRNVATIKNISSIVNPYYLSTFLNSKFGKYQMQLLSTGNVQPLLNLLQVKSIKVCIPNISFQSEIEQVVKSAHSNLQQSKSLYSEAEDILLSELGIKDWQPNNNPINIKQLKESFLASGRLDAEYYQPKYEDYSEFIKHYKGGSDSLGKICFVNDKNYNPSDDSEYKYIELSNIGDSGEIAGCTTSIGAELPSRARRLVHTNDVIVSSIEGSLQSVALVTDEYDKAICSTGFYVVNSKTINPETLLVLFKSGPVQNLLKQGCSGTILTAIGKTEFQNLLMPKIRKEVQTEIAEYVQKSISLRNEAKQLLESAKLKVEDAISTPPPI